MKTQADDTASTKHAKKDHNESKPHGGAAAKKAEESSGIAIKNSATFLRDVVKEAKKINWPPRGQVMQETWSVIVLVAFITVMVLGFDYALGSWVFGPIEHFAKVLAPQTAEQSMFGSAPGSLPGGTMPMGGETPAAPPATPEPAAPSTTTPAAPATPETPATTPPAASTPAPASPAPQATPQTAAPATAPAASTPAAPTATPTQAPATPTTPRP